MGLKRICFFLFVLGLVLLRADSSEARRVRKASFVKVNASDIPDDLIGLTALFNRYGNKLIIKDVVLNPEIKIANRTIGIFRGYRDKNKFVGAKADVKLSSDGSHKIEGEFILKEYISAGSLVKVPFEVKREFEIIYNSISGEVVNWYWLYQAPYSAKTPIVIAAQWTGTSSGGGKTGLTTPDIHAGAGAERLIVAHSETLNLDAGAALNELRNDGVKLKSGRLIPEDTTGLTPEEISEREALIKLRIYVLQNSQLIAALKDGTMKKGAILCIGESSEEKDAGVSMDVVKRQLWLRLGFFQKAVEEGLISDEYYQRELALAKAKKRIEPRPLTQEEMRQVIIAYEPRWAIGKDPMPPGEAQKMAHYIRGIITELYGEEISNKVIIQYGGAIDFKEGKKGYIGDYLVKEDIDGGLVGGASSTPEGFVELLKIASNLGPKRSGRVPSIGANYKLYLSDKTKDFDFAYLYLENYLIEMIKRKIDFARVEVTLTPVADHISILYDLLYRP